MELGGWTSIFSSCARTDRRPGPGSRMWRGPDLSKIHGDGNGKGYFTATLYISGVSMALRLGVKRGNEHNLKRRALRNLSSDAQMVHIISSFNVKDEHISATLGAPGASGLRWSSSARSPAWRTSAASSGCRTRRARPSRPSARSSPSRRTRTFGHSQRATRDNSRTEGPHVRTQGNY